MKNKLYNNKIAEEVVYKTILSISKTLITIYDNYYLDKYENFYSFVSDIPNIDKQEILNRKEK